VGGGVQKRSDEQLQCRWFHWIPAGRDATRIRIKLKKRSPLHDNEKSNKPRGTMDFHKFINS